MANIRSSYLEVSRDIWLVYANPKHEAEVFDKDPFWRRAAELPGPRYETFALYRQQRG